MTEAAADLPEAPRGLARARILLPVRLRARRAWRALLGHGSTPEKVALSLSLGMTLGLFPVFGVTTFICLLLAMALRLNHPAIQLANQAMYPVQIPLVLVFVRLGERLSGAPPAPILVTSVSVLEQLRAEPLLLLARLGKSGLHGVLGWAAVAPLIFASLYAVSVTLLRRRLRAAA